MFRAFSRLSSGVQWLQWPPLILPSYRGDSRAVARSGPVRSGPARPRTQYDCHHDTKVKPEASTAVIELLMMGGKTPETCWAVNKRQDNKLKNCCIWLVIYLNSTMMHGLTNLKFHVRFSCKLMRIMQIVIISQAVSGLRLHSSGKFIETRNWLDPQFWGFLMLNFLMTSIYQ
jgi:hypothetical protein